jgi:hypothetical protein
MSFHQNINVNMKFRFSLIKNDPQIDFKKHIKFEPKMRFKGELCREHIEQYFGLYCPYFLSLRQNLHFSPPFVKIGCFLSKI